MKKTKEELPICESKAIHNETIQKVKKSFPKEEIITDTADFFKVLGDATRMKILSASVTSQTYSLWHNQRFHINWES